MSEKDEVPEAVQRLADQLLQLKIKRNEAMSRKSTFEDVEEARNTGRCHSQLWVSISGAPGCGKSTLSSQLSHLLPNSIVVPMDGFHFYKSQLRMMPDPEFAFARRGAAWTFDAEKFVEALKTARDSGTGLFPSFDHAIGDPIENDILVEKSHDYVIVEGLYLLLPFAPWNLIKEMMDVSVFVNADPEVLRSRLIKRHMECFHMTETEAKARADENDLPNGVDVIASKDRADVILDNN